MQHSRIVSHNHHCPSPIPRQRRQNLHHGLSALGIERRRRFVRQDDPRLARECSSDRNPLLLTAAHVRRIVLAPIGKAHLLQQFACASARRRLRHSFQSQSHFDVLLRC